MINPDYEMIENFVLNLEQGYVNNARDNGGETNFGISKRAYPKEDIKNLTLDRARQLYKRDYWDKIQGDRIPTPVALMFFDLAINSGVSGATKMLQKLVNVKANGKVGDGTIKAIENAWLDHGDTLLDSLTEKRMDLYKNHEDWDAFGKGWTRRAYETRDASYNLSSFEKQEIDLLPDNSPEKAALTTFGKAFKLARSSGKDVFTYKGKEYTTKLKTG